MNLSFKYRILLCFVLLLTFSLALMILLTFHWVTKRAEADLEVRLSQNKAVLERVHETESRDRARRFNSLTFEPRFRALVEIQHKETLQYAATEVRNELNCDLFAFVTSVGDILAWDGPGQDKLRKIIPTLINDREESATEIFNIGDDVIEVSLSSIRVGNSIKGYILAGQTLDASVLNYYSVAVGAPIELRANNERVTASNNNQNHDKQEEVIAILPLNDAISLVIRLDSHSVHSSLYDTFRAIVYISA